MKYNWTLQHEKCNKKKSQTYRFHNKHEGPKSLGSLTWDIKDINSIIAKQYNEYWNVTVLSDIVPKSWYLLRQLICIFFSGQTRICKNYLWTVEDCYMPNPKPLGLTVSEYFFFRIYIYYITETSNPQGWAKFDKMFKNLICQIPNFWTLQFHEKSFWSFQNIHVR